MGNNISSEQAVLPFAFASDPEAARSPTSPATATARNTNTPTVGLALALQRSPLTPSGTDRAEWTLGETRGDTADGDGLLDPTSLRPIRFGQLTSLVTIGLCSQGLMKLSPNVGLLFATTTLQLCCNNLTSIPSEIGHLQNLQILSVARNKLEELPDTIGYLTKLVELRAADNYLASLPASVGMLKKLATFSLENNRLEELPVEIGGLTALVNLDLSGNPLKAMPAEIGRLKFLRKLRLEECPLLADFEYPPTNPFPSLKELAARVIVRNQVPILQDTQEELKAYLGSARSCSFCGGPYFETSVKRGKFIEKNEYRVPLEYSLCITHWTTEQERISALFCPPPETAPSPIVNSPNISPPPSPLFGRRRRSSMASAAMSRSNSITLPLSSAISKSPSLPDLPPVEVGPSPRKPGMLTRSSSISALLGTRPLLRTTSNPRV